MAPCPGRFFCNAYMERRATDVGIFQSALDELLRDVPFRIAAMVIAEKAKSAGVTLSARQEQILLRRIRAGTADSLRLKASAGVQVLSISAEDIAEAERRMNAVGEQLPAAIESVTEKSAAKILATLKKRWPRREQWERGQFAAFSRRLAATWKEPLALLSMLLAITREFGDDVRAESDSSSNLAEVLIRLHAKACQVALEVSVLLRAGLADGAMARWRTLHEIAVTAHFLRDHGEEAAERFVAYRDVEAFQAAKEYQRCHIRLGYQPMDALSFAALEARCKAAVNRFGDPFKEPYGWAAHVIQSPRPRFVDVEKKVDLNHWRAFYKIATRSVHANATGAYHRIAWMDEEGTLSGSTNFGLADPGQNTALSLTQTTAVLGMLHPTMDRVIGMRLVSMLSEETCQSFVSVQTRMANAGRTADARAGR